MMPHASSMIFYRTNGEVEYIDSIIPDAQVTVWHGQWVALMDAWFADKPQIVVEFRYTGKRDNPYLDVFF